MDNPITNTINAGCYIFSPRIVRDIKLGQVVSVEREVFPELLQRGELIQAYLDNSYWLDMGTPKALLQGSRDFVGAKDFIVGQNSKISESAKITGSSAIGSNVTIGDHVIISGSIIRDGAVIGAGSELISVFVETGAIVAEKTLASAAYCADGAVAALNI
jgi:mannose-1-phosphate guanylyltransferase